MREPAADVYRLGRFVVANSCIFCEDGGACLVDGAGGVDVAGEGVDLGHGEDEHDGEDGEAESEEEGPRYVPFDAS